MGYYFAIFASLICYFASPIICARRTFFAAPVIPSVITFTLAFVLQQILFALFASLGFGYGVSFVLGALIVFSVNKISLPDIGKFTGTGKSNLIPWMIFLVVLSLCLFIRSHYPFINFVNNGDEVGVEKLFNYSMQQSFLFGKSYPPEWVWLAGEPIRYYTFMKSIPGLMSWLARAWFGNSDTGGFFFIFSESFYAALFPSLVASWIFWFGRDAKNQCGLKWLAACIGVLTLVGTHFQAFSMGVRAAFAGQQVNWWLLSSQVVPFTDNQYSAWLLMIGDNHAYFQVYFLQVLFWGLFLSLVVADEVTVLGSSIVGAVVASLLISHPGSLLVNLCSIGGFIVALLIWIVATKEFSLLRRLFINASYALGAALVVAGQLYQKSGEVKFVVPARQILSKFIPFLNLNFSVFLLLGFVVVLFFSQASSGKKIVDRLKKTEWIWVIVIIASMTAYLFGREALPVLFIASALTFYMLSEDEYSLSSKQNILALFAASSFFIWFMPEVIAFDHKMDNRVEWIRFQMSLRFWPEGYILIPLALGIGSIKFISEKKINWFVPAIAIIVISLFAVSHIPGFVNRAERAHQKMTLNGASEFSTRYPSDSAITTFLRALPVNEKVVVGELCGIGNASVPVDFGWSGRIAAYSGRTGICGWARHAMLYNSPLGQPGFQGIRVEEKLTPYLDTYINFLKAIEDSDGAKIYMYRMALRNFGVTHFVFGNQEKFFFPDLTIAAISKGSGEGVLFQNSDGTGVLKISQ